MDPANAHLHYQVNYGSTILTVGDTVYSTFTLSPTAGDADPGNNYCVIKDTVKAGCDPNAMWVSPDECIYSGVIPLQYTVNFMNVGNDTAFNIYVMDTLPSNVDPSSLRVVMATNVMNTVIFKAGGYNIVKFDFPQINLLDSAACPQCNGGVTYSINTKSSLDSGATIQNHAGVFFDDNPVVMTNVVQNTVGCPYGLVGVASVPAINKIEIYPNPTIRGLTISATNTITEVTITNLVGQTVYTHEYNSEQVQIDAADFPGGVYFVKINGSEVRKFVKE